MSRATSDRSCVAIDIGGTKIAAALVQGMQILKRRQAPTPKDETAEVWIDTVVDLIDPWITAETSVGAAVTGVVVNGYWSALSPDVLPVPQDFPLERTLSRRIGRPVTVINDGQASAWGEYRFGAGQGFRSVAFVTISTGVGGGLILDGRLITGHSGLAGNIGHIVADPGGPTCGCGKVGCLEAVASGSAIVKAAAEWVTAEEVFAKAKLGDHNARGLIDRSAEAVARAIADMKALLDIQLAVIGGGVGLAPGYLERVAHSLGLFPKVFRPSLAPAQLGGDCGLIGVADWATRNAHLV